MRNFDSSTGVSRRLILKYRGSYRISIINKSNFGVSFYYSILVKIYIFVE